MQILGTFFKIAQKLSSSLIINLAIFITIGMFTSAMTPDPSGVAFESSKLKIAVFDEDNTAESKALCEYIGSIHTIKELTEDEKANLLDQLYYMQIDYALTINSGYAENLRNGKTADLFTYSVDPQSYSYEYFNIQLTQYVSSINTYMVSGMDFEAAQKATLDVLGSNVKVTVETSQSADKAKIPLFYRYIAYVVPAMLITMLSRIIVELKGKEVKNRTFCSPISSLKFNGQIIVGSLILCFAIWILLIIVTFIFTGIPTFDAPTLLTILNSFVFVLVSAGIGILISTCLSKNSFIIDMLSNIICLGMSFLCGVFVQQSLLGEGVLSVAKFLPAYWYVNAFETAAEMDGRVFDPDYIFFCIGIQLLFAAALFAVSLAVAKFKKNKA